ncbi:MAG: PEP-CTERM sorting domain-containing protein [Planctomycetales bacterium]
MIRHALVLAIFLFSGISASAALIDPFTTSQTGSSTIYPDDLGIGPQPTNSNLGRLLLNAGVVNQFNINITQPGALTANWLNNENGTVILSYDDQGSGPFDLTFGNTESALQLDFGSVTSSSLRLRLGLESPDSGGFVRITPTGGNPLVAGTYTVPFSSFSGVDPTEITNYEISIFKDVTAGTASFNLGPAQAIPEPTSLAMLGLLTLVGTGCTILRRRRAKL